MKIKTDPTVKQLSGRLKKSKLVFLAPSGKRCTSARSFRKPATTQSNADFATRSNCVRSVLDACQPDFCADLLTYLNRFNSVAQPVDRLPQSISSLFQSACFRAAAARGLDLLNLSLDNFNDYIDGNTVFDLLRTAGLPLLSFSSSDLDAPYLEWGSDLFNWQDGSLNGITSEDAYELVVTSEQYYTPPDCVKIRAYTNNYHVILPFDVYTGERYKVSCALFGFNNRFSQADSLLHETPDNYSQWFLREFEFVSVADQSPGDLLVSSSWAGNNLTNYIDDFKIFKHV